VKDRPHHPHDKLFKAVFSDPENAVTHFEATLPPAMVSALDMGAAEHVPGSWVDEALRDHHSDLLYRIPLRGCEPGEGRHEEAGPRTDGPAQGEPAGPAGALLYVLWEHQSSVRPFMALKLLRYVTRVLDEWSREHPGTALPPLIPLVLYHGDATWSAPLELEELFEVGGLDRVSREAIRPYLPRLRYLLDEVPPDPDAVRAAPGIVRLALRVLKVGRSPRLRAYLFDWQEDFRVEVSRGARGLHHIGLIVEYLLVVNAEVTPEDLSEALKPMGQDAQEIPKPFVAV
jgi:hypothetical protein